jgi:ACS family D-galactonate transporter-like MFS transporter
MSGARALAIPRQRWGIALLLGAGVLINYFDRLNLAVAGTQLRTELHLDPLSLDFLMLPIEPVPDLPAPAGPGMRARKLPV